MNLADYCGNELADKCQNVMLASYGSNYAYSMQLNGYNYGIFSVWDNVNMVCSKGDAPAPSIGSTVSGYCNVCTVGSSLFAGVGYNGISGQLTDTIYSNLMSTVSTTSNGGYSLVIEGDGGLVHYNQGNALWRSGSAGNPAGSYRAIMQTDGNLVVYDNSGNALWSTGTYGTGNGFNCAVVQTDSNFVVYDQDCNAQWWEW